MSDPAVNPAELSTVPDFWTAQVPTYDEDVDHGLTDPAARAAWAEHLTHWLPEPPATVLDLGCGTGSLSLLATEAGHRVRGVDLSPAMVAAATRKCAGRDAVFVVADAGAPPFFGPVDAVLARHLVWTLPDPGAALARWVGLLRPGGHLVLVEGRWWTAGDPTPYARGADAMPWAGGVRAEDLVGALDPLVARLQVHCLSDQDVLWGRAVEDERYAVVATAA